MRNMHKKGVVDVRRILSLVVVLALCLSSMTVMTFAATDWEAGAADVKLRVGIIGDTHTSANTGDTFDWFKKNVNALLKIGANKLDGLALTGDVIYHTSTPLEANYDAVMSVLSGTHDEFKDTGIAKLPKVFAMGNHEYPLLGKDEAVLAECRTMFKNKTGLEVRNTAVMNGYTFIAAGAEDYYGNVSAETEAWLMAEIDKALAEDSTNDVEGAFADGTVPNSTKPVFVALHHPISNTIFGLDNSNYTADFVTYLKSRPQVIVLTGHMHRAAQLPATIWQDGFTIFQTSHSAGGNLSPHETDDDVKPTDVHQGSMIEIDNNGVVKLYKLDFVSNEYIGDPWIVDIPAIVADRTNSDSSDDNANYLYSADKRANPNAPSFPSDAELSVTVDGCSVSLEWEDCAIPGEETPNQQDDFVRGYKVEICDSDDNVITSKSYQAEFYYPEASRKELFGCDFGLSYNVNYIAKVYPMGGLGSLGEPITAEFTTDENTVPAGATRYEAENYIDTATYPNDVKTNTMASGGALAGSTWTGSTGITITIPVTVDTAGYYDLSYAMGQQTSADVSKITVAIDGTTLGTNGTGYTKNISNLETYPWSNAPMRIYENKNYYLTAQEHTVTITVDGVKSASGARKYFVDYFQIQFPEDRTVTGDAPVVVEFEDFVTSVKVNKGASGDAIASSSWKEGNCDISIPVKVEDSGYYDFEFVIGYTSDTNSYPQINISFGDIGLGNNVAATAHDATLDTSVYTDFYSGMPLRRYKYSGKWIDEGTHNIVLDFLPADNVAKKYNLDYFKISPTVGKRTEISGSEATTIEFEIGVPGATIYDSFGGSDGGLIYSGWTSRSQIIIPVSFDKTGYYSVEYVLGALKTGTDHSKWELYLDDTLLGSYSDSDTIGGNAVPEGYTDVYAANSIRRFRENGVWIEKGNYLVKLVLQKTANGNGDHYTYVADYIKFMPKNTTVSKDAATVIEYEDYSLSNGVIRADSGASGGYFMSSAYITSNPMQIIKVDVKDAGYYDFEVAMGDKRSDSFPLNFVSVNGNIEFYGNSYTQYEDITSNYTNYGSEAGSNYMGMRRFKKKIWLDEGINEIKTSLNISGSYYRFNFDYIKLTPLDTINVNGSKVTVTGIYDEPLSGTAILALYKGDTLITTKKVVAENVTGVKLTAVNDADCDKAKLFFWNNTDDMTPLSGSKEFTVE